GYSSHRTGYTALFEDLDHDKVVGCGIVSINPQTHKGYLRGLMILPEYQGKIAIMDCVINGMTYTYYRHGADTNLWYTETRSAHNKAQYLMEACGFRPCAIFPNKDIFYGNNIRESDVLEVTYNEFTLDQKRYEDIEILPLLLPIYEFMADRYNLPPAIIKREEIDLGLPFLMEGNRIKARCHLEKVKGKYNTSRYIIKSPNGGELSFKITETVMAAEELKVQANSYEEFMALFLYLRELMFKENIHYFEYYLPMNDVNKQAILLGLGFSVFGYVPAWEPIDKSEPRLINGDPTFQDNVNEGKDNKLIDSIIFGMALKFPKPESIKLTPYGKMLLKILLDLNHYG
ncbi:MAG: GNAT family N-acetyltransferase, partial [Promethearchaeota archaeon]